MSFPYKSLYFPYVYHILLVTPVKPWLHTDLGFPSRSQEGPVRSQHPAQSLLELHSPPEISEIDPGPVGPGSSDVNIA